MTQKIAIVGAGPGGLAAAMLLAAKGVEVDVYERESVVGGRTTTWEKDGFRFDLGPTFFMYPRILSEIFEACGEDLNEEVEMVQLDPQYRLSFVGRGHIDATADIEEMERQIEAFAPGQKDGFRRFLKDNRYKLEKSRTALERPFNGWGSLLATDVMRVMWNVAWNGTVEKELSKYFSDPLLRIAFSFQAKYLGMSPYQCPSFFTILAFLEYEHGIHHPIGGFGKISEAMARIAREKGANFLLSTPVEEVEFEGKQARAIITKDGRVEYDAIVVNGDFAGTIPQLIPNDLRRDWSDARIEAAEYSCSTFMLYLGIEGVETDLPHHTIIFPPTYHDALDGIGNRHDLSDDPPMYVQNVVVTDPGQAPEGHSTLYVLVPVTHMTENVDWSVEKERFTNLVLESLEAYGIENLRARIRTQHVISPADWQDDYGIYQGAVFNLAHTISQMLNRRPRNRFQGTKGVYLVGGGTHPGSGLPTIYESARISAKLLCEDLGVLEQNE
jgi:phytoene desaturase